MQETNWKTWATIAIVLVGATFEVFKRLPERASSTWDMENLNINNASQPYNVRNNIRSDLSGRRNSDSRFAKPTKVAAQSQLTRDKLEQFVRANAPKQTNFDHLNSPENKTTANKKKKNKDDEWEEIIDPRTGKKIRRKKKKKQAKKEEKKEQPQVTQQEEQPPSEQEEDNNIDGTLNQAIASGAVSPPPDTSKNELNNSMDDWIKRLLTQPSTAETKRFIEQYSNRLISAEIFYKITEMMIEDSRQDMKRLGVLCAGLTPSVMSFQVLAQVVEKERSDSKPRQDAESFLNRFTDMNYINVLENILRARIPSYSTLLAAQKLEVAAQRHLSQNKKLPPSRQPTQSALNANANYFRRYLNILKNLANSNNVSIKEQAGRTLASLQNLLNIHTNS